MPVKRIQILLEEEDFRRAQVAKKNLATKSGASVTWLDLLMLAVAENEPTATRTGITLTTE